MDALKDQIMGGGSSEQQKTGEQKQGEIVKRITAYVTCVLGGVGSCNYTSPIAYGLSLTTFILLSSVGFFMSLIFITRSTFAGWRYIIGRTTGLFDVSDWESDINNTGGYSSTTGGGTHSGSHSGM